MAATPEPEARSFLATAAPAPTERASRAPSTAGTTPQVNARCDRKPERTHGFRTATRGCARAPAGRAPQADHPDAGATAAPGEAQAARAARPRHRRPRTAGPSGATAAPGETQAQTGPAGEVRANSRPRSKNQFPHVARNKRKMHVARAQPGTSYYFAAIDPSAAKHQSAGVPQADQATAGRAHWQRKPRRLWKTHTRKAPISGACQKTWRRTSKQSNVLCAKSAQLKSPKA